MDDAREWTATAPRGPAEAPAVMKPGDPWGATLWGSDPAAARRPEVALDVALGAPGGVWRRATALVVDVMLVVLLVRSGVWLAAGLAALTPSFPLVAQALGVTWLYFTPVAYFVLSHGTAGQTLGKRLVGVRVIDEGGASIGYVRALGRCVSTVLAALPLGIGLLMVAARADRRGLHDFLAGTRVVRTR